MVNQDTFVKSIHVEKGDKDLSHKITYTESAKKKCIHILRKKKAALKL